MTWHITARMAWHDRGWDGRVCDDPAANSYCTGSHSLLSERLAREKKVECETPCAALDADLPGYQPPCFWTSSAFAPSVTRTIHRHPFPQYRDTKQIEDTLPAHAIYTWPFRLSITHDSWDRHGQYFPDLDARIERYGERLTRGRSLIFFYLNYDNPVSADDYKYALVGCARLTDIADAGDFEFKAEELAELRSQSKHMKNFPTTNWALKLSHEGPGAAVLLPYHAYLKHLETHPEDEAKLEEIRVLIDEPALLPRFKYVSEQVHDDHALALLYKLKRALERARAHGIAEVDGELDRIDGIIADCWADRGLYPGLGAVVTALADLADGEVQPEGEAGEALVAALRPTLLAGADLADTLFALLVNKDPLPDALAAHKRTLRNARLGLRDHETRTPLLRKLALFTLTSRQVGRILFPDADTVPAFGPLALSDGDIAANPYLLAESYVPAITSATEERADLDRELRSDSAIDYAVIDIGMFPDADHLEPHDDLHDLTVAGPERLRAFAIEALRAAEALGHSFVSSVALAAHVAQHPLFYRDKLAVSEAQLLSARHLAHFRERLHVEVVDAAHFFYRQPTWNAERIVTRFVTDRLALPPLKPDTSWLAAYLTGEAKALGGVIPDFAADSFIAERTRLMTGALTQRFYGATGRPGSGKSQAVVRLLAQFDALGEATVVLTPTGKAALRLNKERAEDASWEAQTIDRWLWRSGLGAYADADLAALGRADRFEPFDNLVIEESSMVDLFQLALIFRAIEVHQPSTTKRVILVGDENQLPPIGCGKPLQDILAHLRADPALEAANHVRLGANCRQQHDTKVLEAAHLFAGRNRYHSELLDAMCQGGQISPCLDVRYYGGTDELHAAIDAFMTGVLDQAVPGHADLPREQAFNLLMNLFEGGSVRGFRAESLALDRAQLLSPYRGGVSGALGLGTHIRDIWRADVREQPRRQTDGFYHSDKLVRISNLYLWNKATRTKELRLSNGSIGVLSKTAKQGWQGFFPESSWSLDWNRMDEEDFELAYALTVHKAQGSEFAEVLMVVPERRALLSSELLYTAMTRSKGRLTLLVEKSERANPLRIARDRSVLAMRNSSVFAAPFDAARLFEPEPGIRVKSKIEYMIYTSLVRARDAGQLSFAYEAALELPFGERQISVRPDFTVQAGGKTYYWEHLGMLDRQDYARDWRDRRRAYQAAGLDAALITTDDAAGVHADTLAAVIADLVQGAPAGRADLGFSAHHYPL